MIKNVHQQTQNKPITINNSRKVMDPDSEDML